MITVRFPSGLAVTYNEATHGLWDRGLYVIKTKRDGDWVASVVGDAIIECTRPCRVEMEIQASELEPLAKEIRTLQRKLRKR